MSRVSEELERHYRESLREKKEALEGAAPGVEKGDEQALATVRRVAHVLRGSGGTYGFPDLSAAAAALEEAAPEEALERLESLLEEVEEVIGGAAPRQRDGGGPLVLVVDDDPETRLLLETVLGEEEGEREIVSGETGREAWQVLQARDVSLLVLDLFLPDTDGRNLLMRLREHPETAGIPTVVLSGHASERTESECLALGADAFFEKPFDARAVATFVSSRLRRLEREERRSRTDPLTGLENQAALREAYEDREGERVLVFVDLDLFQSVNDRFGRAVGDEVIQRVARVLETCAPPDTHLAYWGDAKYTLLLPEDVLAGGPPDGETSEADLPDDGEAEEDLGPEAGSHPRDLTVAVEGCVEKLRTERMEAPDGETFRVTASLGVVPAEPGKPLDEVLDEAERCVYLAKEAGGNRVVYATADTDPPVRSILVAEDDELTASILKHRFEKEGFRVHHYANGQEAFEGALEDPVSLVILDVKMPGMDGFELLERLRKVPAYKDVPVIMLSSMGGEDDVVRGFDLGADDYILKPFSPTELVARVRRLLRKGGGGGEEA